MVAGTLTSSANSAGAKVSVPIVISYSRGVSESDSCFGVPVSGSLLSEAGRPGLELLLQ